MITQELAEEYENLLKGLSNTHLLGRVSVTNFLKESYFKNSRIKKFYKENALVVKDKIDKVEGIMISGEEHPFICGGVTEYLTKIKLARKLGYSLDKIKFFDNIHSLKYWGLSDEELAFAMYEPDIKFRSGTGYTFEIRRHKKLIIKKAMELSDIALKLIEDKFPKINSINFHPYGHVMYKGSLAIKGDCDLLINRCLIDFKTKKDASISATDRAQMFAYAINKYMRDGKEYDKIYVLNARFNYLCELVSKE